ncbi:Zinc ribbon domain-containing protein [Rhodovastum atsumiense]|uniref:Zinc ribbon domain-containing protein n=1 Tax=Rhodovastum atsumiense TaxID=504468 RepID=A0A5M6IRP7_9PROT|nr:zinc ribbon domain-containing protein [Rhodovastum atsumiense]KAA5610944.1 zinc ribbon domain-containing protein [Rhodovastum atsumiense]CAH2601482.1 Zinc ribbon domain-containing protein [Rhodovastum atsumiense]
MPLYGFHCTACDIDFETLVIGSEVPTCPECGGTALEQLLSRVAPDMKTPGLVQRARACADCQGHFSNYSPSERPPCQR